jgi:hypothetical protein
VTRGLVRTGRGRRGQALLEVALASPLLIVMLVGGAQFGSLAFGQVTVDTAAREGARTAIENPVSALGGFFSTGGPTSMTCSGQPSYSNSICQAVLDSPGNYGLLSFDPKKFTITVTAHQPPSGPWSRVPDDGGIVLASACGGTTVKGSVSLPNGSNASGATVSASGSGVTGTAVNTNNAGNFTLCLSIPSTESVTVSATLTVGGCPETAQVSQTMATSGTVSGLSLTLATCTTTTTTTTTTSTPTTTTTESVTSTSVSATPFTCTTTESNLDGTYVSVKVSYPLPIFVPFIGGVFADNGSGSVRTVTSEVTMRVEPCTLTPGD